MEIRAEGLCATRTQRLFRYDTTRGRRREESKCAVGLFDPAGQAQGVWEDNLVFALLVIAVFVTLYLDLCSGNSAWVPG